MISPNVTLIIKVTNACNMKCRYCFIEPSIFHKTMKLETAQRVRVASGRRQVAGLLPPEGRE